MNVLFDFENERLLFKHHADSNVKSFVLIGKIRVESIFNESTCIFFIFIDIYGFFDEIGIEVFDNEEFTRHVHHRALFAFIGNHDKARHAGFFSNEGIVGTKSRGDMYDTGTIFGSDIVALDNTESTLTRVNPRDKLLIFSTYKVRTHTFSEYAIRDYFIARIIRIHIQLCTLRIEKRVDKRFCHDKNSTFRIIRIKAIDGNILNFRTDTKSSIRRQSPWSSSPSKEINITL